MIVLAGTIGAGKTSLTQMLADHLGSKPLNLTYSFRFKRHKDYSNTPAVIFEKKKPRVVENTTPLGFRS